MASGPLKKRFRSILRRTLFHPTNWENHVETRKRERGQSRPARARARVAVVVVAVFERRKRDDTRCRGSISFFRSQRRVLAWEITPHADEENARRNNGSVAYLKKKKRENGDAKPRAREDARPAEEGNANANAYLALFSTRREQTKERNHRVRDASMMCCFFSKP